MMMIFFSSVIKKSLFPTTKTKGERNSLVQKKRRKREATALLKEAKKLDKQGIMGEQIKMMQQQLKRI